MGMFDHLICEVPLPDGHSPTEVFQTKDTPAQTIVTYRITADGELLERQVETQWVEDPDAMFGGHLREVEGTERWVPVPYHGDIEFYAGNVSNMGYGAVVTRDGRSPEFRSYTARFTDGVLARITGGLTPDRYGHLERVEPQEFARRAARERETRKGTRRPAMALSRVELFSDGVVSEIVARGADVHLQHMGEDTWHLTVGEHEFYLGGPLGCIPADLERMRTYAAEIRTRKRPYMSAEARLEHALRESFAGDDEERDAWLRTPVAALGDQSPTRVIESEGTRGVERVLTLVVNAQSGALS